MAIAESKQDLWRRGSKILNFRTGNKNLDFMQVKKETQGVAPLGVDLRDLFAGGLEVRMMLNLYLIFLQRQKYSLVIKFVLTSAFSSLSLDCF